MSYASASDVAAYTPNLTGEYDNFTNTTKPTKTHVDRFLSAACGLIEGRIAAAGYSVPVPTSSYVYDQVSDLAALYAAGRAEMVRMTARVAATERTRSQMFMSQFNTGMDMLLKMDLSRAGLSMLGVGATNAGGISQADKDSKENDIDRVAGRFTRGQFRATGTQRPSQTVSDDEAG